MVTQDINFVIVIAFHEGSYNLHLFFQNRVANITTYSHYSHCDSIHCSKISVHAKLFEHSMPKRVKGSGLYNQYNQISSMGHGSVLAIKL